MNSQPDRERIDGVGAVIILLGVVRAIVALASGNPEHMLFGTIAGLGLAAMGCGALWLNRYNARSDTSRVEAPERIVP